MNRSLSLFFIVLLFYSNRVSGQDARSIDVLLLDARYEEVLASADAALVKTSQATVISLMKNKKAEALIRLGQFGSAAALLREAEAKAMEARSLLHQGITLTNYGLLYL